MDWAISMNTSEEFFLHDRHHKNAENYLAPLCRDGVFYSFTGSSLKLLSVILFYFFMTTLTGCSLEASIQSLNQSTQNIFSKPQSADVVPASSQNSVSTQRGYSVQSSLSYQGAAAEVKTTKRGYRVYTNVQGTLLKE